MLSVKPHRGTHVHHNCVLYKQAACSFCKTSMALKVVVYVERQTTHSVMIGGTINARGTRMTNYNILEHSSLSIFTMFVYHQIKLYY